MEFDKERFYTQVNADELQVGDMILVADNIIDLRSYVENDLQASRIIKIESESHEYRFWAEKGGYAALYRYAYLIERAPKYEGTY